jgi:putative copper export protein
MDHKIIVFALMTFLHDLFTVVWMGGLIVTALSFLPALKEALGPGPQVKNVMLAFQKRQSLWVYISMAGLIATGVVMTHRSSYYEHLFGFGNPYSVALSIKHILVIVMIGITLYRTLVLGRNPTGMTPEKERLNLKLLLANVALAVIVLLVSGLVAAFNTPLHV